MAKRTNVYPAFSSNGVQNLNGITGRFDLQGGGTPPADPNMNTAMPARFVMNVLTVLLAGDIGSGNVGKGNARDAIDEDQIDKGLPPLNVLSYGFVDQVQNPKRIFSSEDVGQLSQVADYYEQMDAIFDRQGKSGPNANAFQVRQITNYDQPQRGFVLSSDLPNDVQQGDKFWICATKARPEPRAGEGVTDTHDLEFWIDHIESLLPGQVDDALAYLRRVNAWCDMLTQNSQTKGQFVRDTFSMPSVMT